MRNLGMDAARAREGRQKKMKKERELTSAKQLP